MNVAVLVLKAGDAIMEVYGKKDFSIELKDDDSPLTLADRRSHIILSEGVEATGIPVLSEEGRDIKFETRKGWRSYWLIDPLDGTREFIKRNDEFTVNIALMELNRPIMGIIYLPVFKKMYFAIKDEGSFLIDLADPGIFSRKYKDIIAKAIKLPVERKDAKVNVVASRSHLSADTIKYVDKLKERFEELEFISAGSSLKLCLIAEGKADVYPRMGPTMEWDIGAGDIIITESGGDIFQPDNSPFLYNKPGLLNPMFIARSKYFKSRN